MDHHQNGHAEVVCSKPTGYRRMLILGYYDGPLDGVIEADTGDMYRFELQGEIEDLWHLRPRPYTLRPLPPDAMDRLVAALSPFFPPKWPWWGPTWSFPDPASQAAVETQVDAILGEAGPERWQILMDPQSLSMSFCEANPSAVPVSRA